MLEPHRVKERRPRARSTEKPTIGEAPTSFFMAWRDIAFWIRSARADAALAKLRARMGLRESFNQLYRSMRDPWGATSQRYRYQKQKYQGLLSILPNREYDNVLDVGCGLGALARWLTPHARQILGIDISDEAITEARRMSRGLTNVRYLQADIYDFQAQGQVFDLIVLADVLYYLAPLDECTLKLLIEKIARLLSPGGLLLLTNHYFFKIDRASRTTSLLHDFFCRSPWLIRVAEYARAFYLATLMERIKDSENPRLVSAISTEPTRCWL